MIPTINKPTRVTGYSVTVIGYTLTNFFVNFDLK